MRGFCSRQAFQARAPSFNLWTCCTWGIFLASHSLARHTADDADLLSKLDPRTDHQRLPRSRRECRGVRWISAAHSGCQKIARISDDLGIIEMYLGVDKCRRRIEPLFHTKTPAANLSVRQGSPDHRQIAIRIYAQRLANIEILIKSVVCIKCSFAKRQPLLADAQLQIIKMGERAGPAEGVRGGARPAGNRGV